MESVARIIYGSFLGISAIALLGGLIVLGQVSEKSFSEPVIYIAASLILYATGWIARYLMTGNKSTILTIFPNAIKGVPWFIREVAPKSLATLSYILCFCFAAVSPIVGLDVIDRTPRNSFGSFTFVILACISASLFFFIIGWAIRHLTLGEGSFHSKLATLKTELSTVMLEILRWWGILFRAIFIFSIGIGGYLWLDPQPLGDVPFSQLTLNKVFSNLFAVILSVGCFIWFVNFPKQKKKPESPNDDPYVIWRMFSLLFMFLTALIAAATAAFIVVWT